MELLKTQNSELLKKAVQVYDRTHEAITKNVANVNTTGYKRVNTDFSDVLKDKEMEADMKNTHEKHIQSSHYNQAAMDMDESENNVDLTEEMTALAQNQIRQEFATRLLNRHYSGLTTAITGQIR